MQKEGTSVIKALFIVFLMLTVCEHNNYMVDL